MKKINLFIALMVFMLSMFLVACGSTAPQRSPEEEQAHLATMVAATVEAAQNADAESAPPADGEPAPAAEGSAAPEADLPEAPAPVMYPDFPGLRVAYIKDGNIYYWTEGGSSIGVTNTGDAREVVISDDGQYIAYVRELAERDFAFELWVINSDGGPLNPQMLVSFSEMDALLASSPFTNFDGLDFDHIDWRPGTHILAYSTTPRFMGPGYAAGRDLRTINIDTMEKKTVFDFGEGGVFTFSPDGTQMALSTPEGISLANADGSNLRANILTYPVVATYSEFDYHPSPIWAADSASLRVMIPPEDPFMDDPLPTTFWFLPTDGSPATQLGMLSGLLGWPENSFSPDLSYIAYVIGVGEPTENRRELHIAYADGSNDYLFAAGPSIQFRGWAPDNARFVYALNGSDDQGLYLGNITGGASTIASLNQTVHKLQWVDSSRFIFIYDYAGKLGLNISDQDGVNHAYIDSNLTEPLASFDFTP